MATFRVGVGSFNINDGSVGIGTEGSGHGNLKVEGTLKSTSADVLGVSTFTRYSGFNADNVSVSNRDLTLSGEYSTTGDVVIEDGASLRVGVGSTACVGSVECISVKHHFSVPVGDTSERNKSSGYAEGTVRYNRDLGTVEFFNGNEWRQFTYVSDIKTNPQGSGRCVKMGGSDGNPAHSNVMEYVNINTLGNSIHFGELTQQTDGNSAVSSQVRAVNLGGYRMPANSLSDVMDYITIQSEGNAIDFGDMVQGARYMAAGTNGTRALIMGGAQPGYTTMITPFNISSLGNAVALGIGSYLPAINSLIYIFARRLPVSILLGSFSISITSPSNTASNLGVNSLTSFCLSPSSKYSEILSPAQNLLPACFSFALILSLVLLSATLFSCFIVPPFFIWKYYPLLTFFFI